MIVFNTHDAKTQLSRLLERAARGEEIVIARAGVPIARLVAYVGPHAGGRSGGHWRGQVRIGNDFDDPLPRAIKDAFSGEGD